LEQGGLSREGQAGVPEQWRVRLRWHN
jgi:hypothetical protein